MSDGTKIEWTDATWTPIRARAFVLQSDGSGKERIGWHCEHASDGCKNCYAEGMNLRLGTGFDYKPGHLKHTTRHGDPRGDVTIFLDEKMLQVPLRWKKPRKIFVCSMTDLFADFVTDEMIDKVFAVMALCPQHTFQVLTKRSSRMRRYIESIDNGDGERLEGFRSALVEGMAQSIYHDRTGDDTVDEWLSVHLPLKNVWLGVSVEDQTRADERIPDLLATPAAVRWISAEPLLGPVDLNAVKHWSGCNIPEYGGEGHEYISCLLGDNRIDWVVAGGESGPGARPMHPDWARGLRDQCAAAGVAFNFKQWGSWREAAPGDEFDTAKGRLNKPPAFIVSADDGSVHCFLNDRLDKRARVMLKIGKKRAGRLLDGVEWNGYPA